jgi:hypothetical protein
VAPLVFATPLCAARARRRAPVEALLLARGAREERFDPPAGDFSTDRYLLGHSH